MLDLFGWEAGMSTLAGVLLVFGAVLIGIVSYLIGEVRAWWQPVLVAIAALIGGYIGSESLGTASTWGYAFEDLNVWPAVIGALLFGVVTDAIVRFYTGGAYVHHPQPI